MTHDSLFILKIVYSVIRLDIYRLLKSKFNTDNRIIVRVPSLISITRTSVLNKSLLYNTRF